MRRYANRPGAIRLWIGSLCLRASQWLLDPWDRWLIEYHNDEGRLCAEIREGFYSTARACARELKGRIIGHNASEFPADGEAGVLG